MVLGILSGLRGGFTKSIKGVDPNKGALVNASPATLFPEDFFTADVTILASKKNIVGEYLIGPQEEQALGYGSAQFPDNQGNIIIDLRDTTDAELQGTVRLLVGDYNDKIRHEVFKGSAADLRLGLTDITKRLKFPKTEYWGGHNDKVTMEFTPTDAGDGKVDYGHTEIRIASSLTSAQGLRNI